MMSFVSKLDATETDELKSVLLPEVKQALEFDGIILFKMDDRWYDVMSIENGRMEVIDEDLNLYVMPKATMSYVKAYTSPRPLSGAFGDKDDQYRWRITEKPDPCDFSKPTGLLSHTVELLEKYYSWPSENVKDTYNVLKSSRAKTFDFAVAKTVDFRMSVLPDQDLLYDCSSMIRWLDSWKADDFDYIMAAVKK